MSYRGRTKRSPLTTTLAALALVSSTLFSIEVLSAIPASATTTENTACNKPGISTCDTFNYPWYNAPCSYFPYSPQGLCAGWNWGEPNGSGGYNLNDQWGYGYRNCVSYIAWQLAAYNDVPSADFTGLDDAYQWYTTAQNKGLVPTSTTPQVDSVAVSTQGSDGHVMFVTAINPNNTLTVQEYNFDNEGDGDIRTDTPTNLGMVAGGSKTVGTTTYYSGYIDYQNLIYHYHILNSDFNGDSVSDLALYDNTGGAFHVVYGSSFNTGDAEQFAYGPNYQGFVGDFFDGVGHADLGLFDQSIGQVTILYGGTFPNYTHQWQFTWGIGSQYQIFTGDFNGDGYTDLGLRDMTGGIIHIDYGPPPFTAIQPTSFTWAAGSNYIPFSADMNGDRYADIGLFNQATGNFAWVYGPNFPLSPQGAFQSVAVGQNYQPFAGDFYDGNCADLGVRDADIGMIYFFYGGGCSQTYPQQKEHQWAAD